jgi:transposase
MVRSAAFRSNALSLANGGPCFGLWDRFAILTSAPGVSNITAFHLLIETTELGALEAGQAASLVGLAPIARHSGRWTGRAFVRSLCASARRHSFQS